MSRIEIITIGDELVDGRLLDTNAGWLSDRLTSEGFSVERHTSIRDDPPEIIAAFGDSASRSKAVIVSGGLGPTTDDLTAECAAAAAGVPLHTFAEALEHVAAFFAARGLEMSPNNAKQAELPSGSGLLPNPEGTALGFRLRIDSCDFFFLPGVPRELKHIFTASVLPHLQRTLVPDPPLVHTIKIFGLGESVVGERLDGLDSNLPSPTDLTVQYRATFPEIHVRLVLRGQSADLGAATLEALARDARSRLGSSVFAASDGILSASFIDTVASALEGDRATVAVADCFTGGVLTDLISASPAGGSVLASSTVAPSLQSAVELLGDGEVSDLEGLANDIRRRAAATYGLAVGGTIDGDGTDPPGTVRAAVSCAAGTTQASRTYPIDGTRLKRLTAYLVMHLVRKETRSKARA